jgi:hypothetical protein
MRSAQHNGPLVVTVTGLYGCLSVDPAGWSSWTRLALRASRTAPEVGLLAARGPLQLWLYDKPAL